MSNGGGGGKGFLVVLVCLGLIGGGGYLIWKSMDQKAASTNKDEVEAPKYTTGPKTVKEGQVVEVPFIFWGGDVATFHANGGLETTADSFYGKSGLKCRLTPGDDFDKQVKNYLDDKCPLLRGTLSMLGQASDKLTAKAETTPVVFLQLTWSAGDHLVGRESFTSLNQLKDKTIALQKGGPHVGMLNDILLTTQLDWKDIHIVWTEDVSGDKGPAALLRKDKKIDACFAITPEKDELTATGNDADKAVKGAHVVISTQNMSRSIADVYACRKDFYDDNREWIDKFTANYLKACEDIVDLKQRPASDADAKKRYSAILKQAQDIWGKDPAFKDSVAKEEDVDGLVSDSNFVGLPGNEKFFQTKGYLSGFDAKQMQALRLPPDPATEALKKDPKQFVKADLPYKYLRKLGGLRGEAPNQDRFRDVQQAEAKDEDVLYSFEVAFGANEDTFSGAKYAPHFQRALELASLYGNTTVEIRAHADPSYLAVLVKESAEQHGLIKPKGDGYVLASNGKPYDPKNVDNILSLIQTNPKLQVTDRFGLHRTFPAKEMVDSLQKLSEKRSKAVQDSVKGFASSHGLLLEENQFRAEAIGVRKPKAVDVGPDAAYEANRRVEFTINKVTVKPAFAPEAAGGGGGVNPEEFRLVK